MYISALYIMCIRYQCWQPSLLRKCDGRRQDTEPEFQLDSLPSAPPLPEHQVHALHAATSPGGGGAQHSLYPSLHASTHTEARERPSQSQSRQGQGGAQQEHGASRVGGQTGGGSLGAGHVGSGPEGKSAEASPAVQPAGSLAWAMQTAAGAPRAAVSALSAWLPWYADSSTSSAPEPQQQQQHQACLQTAPSSRRWARLIIPCWLCSACNREMWWLSGIRRCCLSSAVGQIGYV